MPTIRIRTPEPQSRETILDAYRRLKEHGVDLQHTADRRTFVLTAGGLLGGVKISTIRSRFREFFPGAVEVR